MSSTTPTDLFLSLTPHKVIEAVEAAGVLCNRVCYPLNSFENRVYEVECEDRTRIIAKFYRPGRWSRSQILEEHRFLAELADAEIPVCPTRPFPDGETLKQIDHIQYCLFQRTGGRAPDELGDDMFARLGRLTARIHNVGAAGTAEHRVRLSADSYAREDLGWLAERKVIPAGAERRYLAAARAVADVAEERLSGVEAHRIHGDLHPGNLLLRDGALHVLDFDDMVVGPAVQDLWLLLPGRDAVARRQREIFIEGYEELRRFDRSTLALVEPLRGLRMIHYAAWIARRWHDPIFPRTFPHFGAEAYWHDEASALEEVLELSRAGGAAAPDEGADEAPPSGTKYFWDLN
ncbi:serine/threonine protein kinase [Sorangium cellulosum]|uniref:Stress response kinase A n=1 Tax=Sorangium cellulosum TaxID=56 RepID=A0A4V0NDA1_SORCE|nr:serine/threonine protein kinase [Sorangium cellulosum]AUX21952.1 serine/threonine protein kinase [Sorangium cellulosum]